MQTLPQVPKMADALNAPPVSHAKIEFNAARCDAAMLADKLADGYGSRNADRALRLQIERNNPRTSRQMGFILNPTNWLVALIASLVMGGLGIYLDSMPSEHSTEIAIAEQLIAANKEDAARERFERAAYKACGPQAGWREQEDGSIRCYLHTGKKTQHVVQVSAL